MARREYQMKNTLATDPPLRFYFCDAAADYPQAATLRDGDIIYDADLNVLLTADAGVLSSAHAAADAFTRKAHGCRADRSKRVCLCT